MVVVESVVEVLVVVEKLSVVMELENFEVLIPVVLLVLEAVVFV